MLLQIAGCFSSCILVFLPRDTLILSCYIWRNLSRSKKDSDSLQSQQSQNSRLFLHVPGFWSGPWGDAETERKREFAKGFWQRRGEFRTQLHAGSVSSVKLFPYLQRCFSILFHSPSVLHFVATAGPYTGTGGEGGYPPPEGQSLSSPLPGSYLVTPNALEFFWGNFLKTNLKLHKIALKCAKFSWPKKFHFWAHFENFSSSIPPCPLLKPKALPPPWSQNLCPPCRTDFYPLTAVIKDEQGYSLAMSDATEETCRELKSILQRDSLIVREE